MFSKSHRVDAHTHDTLHTLKGIRLFSEHFSIKVVATTPEKSPKAKFSVVVSKKVHKSAVLRNQARRRVYPVVKKLAKDMMERPIVVVFNVQKAITTVSSAEIAQEIDFLLKKARI